MKRLLSIILICFIALTGIACVSASNDFNETVDQDFIVSDINETVIPVDDSADSIDDAVVPTDDIAQNDTDENQDYDEIDNATEDVDEDAVIVIDNSTESDLKESAASVNAIQPDQKWKPYIKFEIPDVEVEPIIVNSGDWCYDVAVYYSSYYNAYKQAFALNPFDPFDLSGKILKPIDAIFYMVYQNYSVDQTIHIVAKLYCKVYFADHVSDFTNIMFLPELEYQMRHFLKDRFDKMYYNPNPSRRAPTDIHIGPDGPHPGDNPNPKA